MQFHVGDHVVVLNSTVAYRGPAVIVGVNEDISGIRYEVFLPGTGYSVFPEAQLRLVILDWDRSDPRVA